MRKRVLWGGLASLALLSVLAVAGIGYLHTPRGRSLPIGGKILGLLGMSCPADQLTSAQAKEIRQAGVRGLAGKKLASSRPALGFELEKTTPQEARKFFARKKVKCEEKQRGFFYLKCRNVSPEVIGGAFAQKIDELTLSFADDKLISVSLLRQRLGPKTASSLLKDASRRLHSSLGEKLRGTNPALEQLYSSESLQFAYRDYIAKLVAVRLPNGVLLSELYAIPN